MGSGSLFLGANEHRVFTMVLYFLTQFIRWLFNCNPFVFGPSHDFAEVPSVSALALPILPQIIEQIVQLSTHVALT